MNGDDERLHPEGAPGMASALGRAFLGDAEFERQQELTEMTNAQALEMNKALLRYSTAKANLWTTFAFGALVAVLFAMAFGVVAFIHYV